jgi:hypothetical protein
MRVIPQIPGDSSSAQRTLIRRSMKHKPRLSILVLGCAIVVVGCAVTPTAPA